ncbi:MAG: hypothetical protein AAF591_17835 [Verrucomicrobiota bacterium]
MATVEINLKDTRERIEKCITEGLRRIDSGEHIGGTSLGIELNSRFGRFILALNDDDDTSFRCDEIASYTRAGWLGIYIPALESERIYEENDIDEEDLRFVVVDRNESQEHGSYEEVVSIIYNWVVQYVKEKFAERSDNHWHPCYISILESETYESTAIVHRSERLPKSLTWSSEPIRGKRIERAEGQGTQVYKVAYRPRKYASLDLIDRKLAFSLPGKNLDELPLPLKAEAYKNGKRVADLIPFFRSEFAIKQNDEWSDRLCGYVDEHSDLLPVTDGEYDWLYVNCLEIADAINNETTKFSYNRAGERIEDIEFLDENITGLKSPIFRAKDYESDGVYFVSRDGEGFLPYCEKNGIRGIDFDLVWTSDSGAFMPLIEEMFELVYARLDRLQGHHDIQRSRWAECLFGYQLELWRTCEFCLTNEREGFLSAIEYLGDLDRVHLPAAIRFRSEHRGSTNKDLAEHIGKRDLLNDFRGYLCRYLPKAIEDLKKMEEQDSDHMAILGPTI